MKSLNKDNLARIGNLNYFDGPLITLFFDKTSLRLLIFDWTDVDEIYNYWLVYAISPFDLNGYIDKKISHLELMKISTDISLVAINIEFDYFIVKDSLDFSEIDIASLPDSSAYFIEHNSPDYEGIKSFLSTFLVHQ
jgi:hypothetical protein